MCQHHIHIKPLGRALCLFSYLFLVESAIAQTDNNVSRNADSEEIEEVKVTAHPLSERGLAQSVIVLSGAELEEKLQGSLGETVASEPGIRSASFGVAVGRPVIHGLGGPRIKTTEDQIDSLDVSVTSTDHAVTIEPFIADKIAILKGASTLLYGSGAIGGVVDVETGRIPVANPDQELTGRAELRAADVADATTAAFRLDGSFSENIAWHIDGFSREGDDYEIPGFVESPALRESQGISADEAQTGTLPGSFFENQGGALGLRFGGEQSYFGFSISHIDAEYGLVGPGEEEEEEEFEFDGADLEEGSARIDMEQTRLDLAGRLHQPFAGVESIDLRFGINDYEHVEIEGNGEVATLFENDAWEGRVTVNHQAIAGFNGAIGLQINNRDFSALGEEAFVPPVETQSVGLFWVAERAFSGFEIEAGLRLDELEHESDFTSEPELDFSTGSASLGIVVPISDAFSISALYDYSSRAPTAEELFSDGAHLATQSFEIGDASLEEETVSSFTVTASYQTSWLELSATAYTQSFDDFIYQVGNGEIEDGLQVLLYQQDDARFTGLDAQAIVPLYEAGPRHLDLAISFDTVDAEVDVQGNRNLPRIPSDRVSLGLRWYDEAWSVKLDYARVSTQDDVADFELESPAFDDISMFVNYAFKLGESELDLFVHGRNLSDDDQRNSTSFVKDFAPAPGRRFEFGVRYKF